MENENKAVEENVQNEPDNAVSGAKNYFSVVAEKSREILKKAGVVWEENKKTIIVIIIALFLVIASIAYRQYVKKYYVSPATIKTTVQKFVEGNVQPGTKVEVSDPIKESGVYKVAVMVEKQSVDAYVTVDGKKLFPQAIDLTGNDEQAEQKETAKTEAESKTDVPEVDLFVMSYCPYGLQAERGILPAVETLGNKIKFNLKFVNYALHGQKEVDENINQYCIQKNQPTKLDAYLKCFWKKSTGNADACMKTVGITSKQVKDCVNETKKQLSPTEKNIGVNKEDTEKYQVQGSPTLVVNGTTISVARDSASFLKAICSGFSNQPKECEKKLSSENPVAGFDDQASGSNGSGAACGQ